MLIVMFTSREMHFILYFKTWYVLAHGAGSVRLEVACEGTVISNSVIFKYKNNKTKLKKQFCKRSPSKENHEAKEQDLKNTLLKKLESLDICTVDSFMESSDTEQVILSQETVHSAGYSAR